MMPHTHTHTPCWDATTFCPNGFTLSKPTRGIPNARDTQAVSQILHLCRWWSGIW